jgi:hypothetical protein
LRSGVGSETRRKRGEVVERSFAHVLERSGMRRTWLPGREDLSPVTISAILMRALFGTGTPNKRSDSQN